MFAKKLQAVVVACAVLALSPAASIRSADELSPDEAASEKPQQKVDIIPLAPGIDAGEAVTKIEKLFPAETGVAVCRLPFVNAIFANGTAEERAYIWKLITPL